MTVEALSETEWRSLLPDYASSAVVVRGSVVPSDLASVAEAISSAGAAVSAYPGVGVAYGAWPGEVDAQKLRLLRGLCEAKHGALVIEKGPVATKGAIDVWGDAGEGFGLMQRLKQELDPSRVLNPGRFAGGL